MTCFSKDSEVLSHLASYSVMPMDEEAELLKVHEHSEDELSDGAAIEDDDVVNVLSCSWCRDVIKLFK